MSSPPTNPASERDDRTQADPEKGGTASDGPNTEPPRDEQTPREAKYSVYTVAEKRGLVLAGAAGAFFSPLSAQIYFPALDKLSSDLHVTVTEVNLTVTTYMVSHDFHQTSVHTTQKLIYQQDCSSHCSHVRGFIS